MNITTTKRITSHGSIVRAMALWLMLPIASALQVAAQTPTGAHDLVVRHPETKQSPMDNSRTDDLEGRFRAIEGGQFWFSSPAYSAYADARGICIGLPAVVPQPSREGQSWPVPGTLGVNLACVSTGGVDKWRSNAVAPQLDRSGSIVYVHNPDLWTQVWPCQGRLKVNTVIARHFEAHAAVELHFPLYGDFGTLSVALDHDETQRYSGTGSAIASIDPSSLVDEKGRTEALRQRYDSPSRTIIVTIPERTWNSLAFPIVVDPPIGTVFSVSTQPGIDEYPDAASDGTQHLVVWTNSGSSVQGQFVTAQGQATGLPFVIWSGAEVNRASICYAPASNQFAIVWDGRITSTSTMTVYGRMVSASGTLGTIHTISVNSAIGWDSRDPDVGATGPSSNRLLVAFTQLYNGTGTDWDIVAVVCNGNSLAPIITPQYPLVVANSIAAEELPAVSKQVLVPEVGEDDLYVVWQRDMGVQHDIEFCNVQASNSVSAIGVGPTWTASSNVQDETEPDIAGDEPECVITWTRQTGPSTTDIYAKRFSTTSAPNPLPGETLVFGAASNNGHPAVAMNPHSTASPTEWLFTATQYLSTGSSIRTKMFTSTGSPLSYVVGSDTAIGAATAQYSYSAVSASNNNCREFLIAFHTTGNIDGHLYTSQPLANCLPPQCTCGISLSNPTPSINAGASGALQATGAVSVPPAVLPPAGAYWTLSGGCPSWVGIANPASNPATITYAPPASAVGTYTCTLTFTAICANGAQASCTLTLTIIVAPPLPPPPAITSIGLATGTTPPGGPSGAMTGGTQVIIAGTGLQGTNYTEVWIGGYAATINSQSSTQLNVTTPCHPHYVPPVGKLVNVQVVTGLPSQQVTQIGGFRYLPASAGAYTTGPCVPATGDHNTLVSVPGVGLGGGWTSVYFVYCSMTSPGTYCWGTQCSPGGALTPLTEVYGQNPSSPGEYRVNCDGLVVRPPMLPANMRSVCTILIYKQESLGGQPFVTVAGFTYSSNGLIPPPPVVSWSSPPSGTTTSGQRRVWLAGFRLLGSWMGVTMEWGAGTSQSQFAGSGVVLAREWQQAGGWAAGPASPAGCMNVPTPNSQFCLWPSGTWPGSASLATQIGGSSEYDTMNFLMPPDPWPNHPGPTVSLRVRTPAGVSSTTPTARYTYP